MMHFWILYILAPIQVICSFNDEIPKVKTSFAYVNATVPHNYRVKRSQGLRIQVHYDEHVKKLRHFSEIKKFVFEPAIRFWQDTVTPKKPNINTFFVPRSCVNSMVFFMNDRFVCKSNCTPETACSTTKVPEKFLDKCVYSNDGINVKSKSNQGTGAKNTDLLILVTSIQDKCTGTTVAYATHCVLQMNDDRPIVGMINICQKRRDIYGSSYKEIIIHEIGHILAFNDGLYLYFRDNDGKPRTKRGVNGEPLHFARDNRYYPSDNSTVVFLKSNHNYAPNQLEYPFLTTPAVTKLAQEYFQCPTAFGIPLEKKQVPHFEERIFQDEMMTPVLNRNAVVSLFTMAVLEDSGWYEVNKQMAQPFSTQMNAGCDFIKSTCYQTLQIRDIRKETFKPPCNVSEGLKCSNNKMAVLKCVSKRINSLEYNKTIFCRYSQVAYDCYSTHRKRDKSYNIRGELFGSSSRCIETSETIETENENSIKKETFSNVGCYRITCSTISNKILIKGLSWHAVCHYTGQQVKFTKKRSNQIIFGNLICPSYDKVCTMNQ